MRTARLVPLLLGLLLPPSAAHAAATAGGARATRAQRDMARIPGGSYRPLYASAGVTRVHVAPFALDRLPVTRGDFLRFVTAHREWRRGAIRPLFADASYLVDWPSTLDAGDARDLRRPVTSVSWFAARAYCAAQGKRLPTLDEWEYVAAGGHARGDVAARRRLLARYAARRPGVPPMVGGAPNAYGVRDLHGVVWEWTLDFNSVVVGDDSRASGGGEDAREHHLFCASAAIGATDPSDYPAFARFATRAALTARSTTSGVGFRCAA